MTDRALLIAALRQCADRLESMAQSSALPASPENAAEFVREYRLLADLCESKPDAEEKLREACRFVRDFIERIKSGEIGPAQISDHDLRLIIGNVKEALAIADGEQSEAEACAKVAGESE